MQNSSVFIIDFLCALLLFIISLLLTLGVKLIYIAIKQHFSPPSKKAEPEKNKPTPKPKAKKIPSAVRSIEINPNEIDRIYVNRDAR